MLATVSSSDKLVTSAWEKYKYRCSEFASNRTRDQIIFDCDFARYRFWSIYVDVTECELKYDYF